MNIYIKPKQYFSTDHAFLKTHGDAIWESLCDDVQEDFFRLSDAAKKVKYLQRFAEGARHRYLRAVVGNVILEGKATGMPAITKTGNVYEWTKAEALNQ